MVIQGPEKNLPKKITGNLDRNHGPNSGQLAAICLTVKLRGFTVKQLVSLQTKINLSSAKGGRLVLRPRWTQHAILPLIYHCVITHDALAQGPGLVKSLADKIFISALLADSVVRNTIFINNHSKTPLNSSFPPIKFDTLRFCQILTITN